MAAPLLFLVNPAAGRGRGAEVLGRLRQAARRAGADLVVTAGAADVTEQARRAVEAGVERLVVAGGDGTAHHAVQALRGTPCALAMLPLGRGNDLASELGAGTDFERALEAASRGPVRTVDLGRCADRAFTNVAGAGFDGDVTKFAHMGFARWRGPWVYPAAVIRALLGFRPPRMRVEYDGGVFDEPCMLLAVASIACYGGGMRIAPGAVPDDGMLDLVLVRAISKLRLLAVFPRVYRGTHVSHPAVRIHRTRRVHLTADRPLSIQADGELMGETGPGGLTFDVLPGALRIVGPIP